MLVRQHLDMGPDIANYLTTMNTLFGRDVTGVGLLRPPLIALPLKLFTLIFGDLVGAKVLGVIMSIAIGVPFYLIAKRISRPWIAVAVTILFVLTPAYSNMLSWGYITMTGIFFTLLSLYFFSLVLESPTKKNVVLAGLFASLTAGFHQLSAAFFVGLFVVLIVLLLLFNRDRLMKNIVPFTAAVAVGVILSLPYVPVYIRLLQMQSSEIGDPALSAISMVQFASDLRYLPWLWAIVIGAAIALSSLRWLSRHDRSMTILLGVLLVLPFALMLFTLRPPFTELSRRAHFFVYVPIWALTAFVLSYCWSWTRPFLSGLSQYLPKLVTVGLVTTLLAFAAVTSQAELSRGLDFYGYLNATRLGTVEWISLNTPEDATIATYPENLAWWIEGKATRTVLRVTDRNMEQYRRERERSLAAERILSRNQGIENGIIRLATTHPYEGAPGNPLVSIYLGGRFQDVLMLDDSQTLLEIGGESAVRLSDAQAKEFVIHGTGESLEMTTTYSIDDSTVIQVTRLDQGSQTATVAYSIRSSSPAITCLELPLFFCYLPASVAIDPEEQHLEIVQDLKTPFDGVVALATSLTVDTASATLKTPIMQADRIPMSFEIHSTEATVTLRFSLSVSDSLTSLQLTQYDVPQLINDYSVDYVAIDLKVDSPLWSDLPLGLEQWLNACPYYKLVYSEGDIRIYQVDVSALP
jgi:hypothetical protein